MVCSLSPCPSVYLGSGCKKKKWMVDLSELRCHQLDYAVSKELSTVKCTGAIEFLMPLALGKNKRESKLVLDRC